MSDRFEDWTRPEIRHGEMTEWYWVVWHPENLELGQNTDIGAFTAIFAHHGVEIGEGVQIGSHCSVYSLNTEDDTRGKVVIGPGAHIGTHCTIMPGVTIGANARVGAHSFVKQDIPDNATAYGVPARIATS